VTKVSTSVDIRGPELTGTHCPAAVRFWDSLRVSGQAQFFQPSDWSAAELVVIAIDRFDEKPQASMLASIQKGMASLLATEGDRRRVRVELEREADEDDQGSVAWIEDARRRIASGAGSHPPMRTSK
jgi:hypothetical protein